MADIFISYGREDRDHADRVAAVLERQGWSVWWDRKVLGGDTFERTIERAMDDARCIIVLWSASSVESGWVKDEAAEGARRKILVPVLIGDVEIPLGFRQIHAVALDASGDVDSPACIDLVASVEQVLRRSPPGSARLATEDTPSAQESPVADQRSPHPDGGQPARGSGSVPRSYLYGAVALALAFATIVIWDRLKTPRGEHTNEASLTSAQSAATAAPIPDAATGASAPAPNPGVLDPGSSPVEASTAGATSSGIVVSGKGEQLYYVFDAAGAQELSHNFTNTPADLFPGDYVAVLNRRSKTRPRDPGRRIVLESGRVTVSGTGGTLFYVHDTTGKTELAYGFTKASVEIFPGDYRVTLNGVSVPATVQPGRDTTIAAGRLMAPGSGSTLYYVYDAAGTKQLTYTFTNSDVEAASRRVPGRAEQDAPGDTRDGRTKKCRGSMTLRRHHRGRRGIRARRRDLRADVAVVGAVGRRTAEPVAGRTPPAPGPPRKAPRGRLRRAPDRGTLQCPFT